MSAPKITYYRACHKCGGWHWAEMQKPDCVVNFWGKDMLLQLPQASTRLIPGNVSPAFFVLYESELKRAKAARAGPQGEESAMPG